MEIKIGRDDFLNGMSKVQGIVESKGAMPILAHVLISTEKDGIVMQATDLEIGIKGFYPAKEVAKGNAPIEITHVHTDFFRWCNTPGIFL